MKMNDVGFPRGQNIRKDSLDRWIPVGLFESPKVEVLDNFSYRQAFVGPFPNCVRGLIVVDFRAQNPNVVTATLEFPAQVITIEFGARLMTRQKIVDNC
jgi:hypothetical protein